MSKFKILHNYVRIIKTYFTWLVWMCLDYKQEVPIFVHFSVFAHLQLLKIKKRNLSTM